ncbi:DUF4831 family protein [Desulfovibrio sp. JC010]|uniref:DUF4831 family protein n=1 Tax=Desulfovibrio sp. JC010 TaxID=2593641 RepID=UPI0013D42320|nr:DUF4831 family protein [Desulfovibrio sp. JC010]
MIKRLLIAICISLFLAGCTTNVANVYPVSMIAKNSTLAQEMVKNKSQGFFYALPKTVLNVEFKVKKVVETPGVFWKYKDGIISNCTSVVEKLKNSTINDDKLKIILQCEGIMELLRSKDAVKKDNTTYKIAESSIVTVVEPDHENQFYVDISADAFTANSLQMTLSEYGIVSDVAVTAEDKSIDYAVAGLKTTASIAGAFFGLGGGTSWGKSMDQDDVTTLDNIGLSLEFRKALFWYDKYLEEEEAFGEFLTFRSYSQGEMTKEMFDIAKANYEARINRYKGMFIGTKNEKVKTFSVKYCPETSFANANDSIKLFSLFNHVKSGGVIYSNSTRLRFDQKVFAVSSNAKDVTDVVLTVSPAMDGGVEKLNSLSKTMLALAGKNSATGGTSETFCSSPPCGLAYRIPGSAHVSVATNSTVLKNAEVAIAQSGLVAYLPRTINGSKSGLIAEYYGESGALKIVNITKVLPEGASVSAGGDAAASAMGVFDKTKNLQNAAAQATAKADIATAKYNEEEAKLKLQNIGESFSAGSGEE